MVGNLSCDKGNSWRLPRNGDLGTGVAELGPGRVEEMVLLYERLVVKGGIGLLGLESHVCVGDLGDVGDPEDDGEAPDKDGDGDVDPLDVLHGALAGEVEEDVGAHDGGDDGADAVEGLSDIDADLRVLGRAADGDVRVRGGLKGA